MLSQQPPGDKTGPLRLPLKTERSFPSRKATCKAKPPVSKGTETLGSLHRARGREQHFSPSPTADACKGQEVKSREEESGEVKRISELTPLESRGIGYLGGQRDFVKDDPKSCRWKAAAVPQQRLKQLMLRMHYAPWS